MNAPSKGPGSAAAASKKRRDWHKEAESRDDAPSADWRGGGRGGGRGGARGGGRGGARGGGRGGARGSGRGGARGGGRGQRW